MPAFIFKLPDCLSSFMSGFIPPALDGTGCIGGNKGNLLAVEATTGTLLECEVPEL